MHFQLDQAIEVLEQTPAVLNALLRHKSPAWLDARKAPAAFSAVDVVGHLMLADTTNWIPRARTILDHGNTRALEPFDRFDFQHLTAGKTIAALLDDFADLRKQSVQTLRSLQVTREKLYAPGLHPDLGAVELSNLLATWVVHDLGHISQVVKTMANEYRDAVGPWRAYLGILG